MAFFFTTKRAPKDSGITLIETIVAMTLLTVVVVMASGALLSVVDANRRVQSTNTAVNNLNFVLDEITRNIRVGTVYHCGSGSPSSAQDCSGGDSAFSFKNHEEEDVYYQLNNGQIQKRKGGGNFLPMTSPQIEITDLAFYVSGAEDDPNNLQPHVIVRLSGEAGSGDSVTQFNVQSMATQRILDLD